MGAPQEKLARHEASVNKGAPAIYPASELTRRPALAHLCPMTDGNLTLKPGLYVTATPIGNLGDITFRAVEALKAADLILCEDTRQTAKLCAAYGVKTKRLAYQEHNAEAVRPDILAKLKDGAAICLVSDAGTPLIADPGFKLVREAREQGVDVIPLPGASAVIAALSAAGAPTDRFVFCGFAPAKKGAREKFFRELENMDGTLAFYESGNRLADSLSDMAHVFGGERITCVARELTKIHEEFRRGRLTALCDHYTEHPAKGEIVVLLFPREKIAASESDIDEFLSGALTSMSVKEAAAAAAAELGVSRKAAYARALTLSGKR